MSEGTWTLKDNENTFRFAFDPATAELTAPVKNRAFVTIKSKHSEISSAAVFIELTPNRTSIRWFVGQQAEPSFARLQGQIKRSGAKMWVSAPKNVGQ